MKFCYIVSAADPKASKGMEELASLFKKDNVSFGEITFAANLPLNEQDAFVDNLLKEGYERNFIQFTKVTVASSFIKGGEMMIEHMYSFDHAYFLAPVRTWLF